MKKSAIIICVFLLLIIASMWTLYTIRKNKIDQQYVGKSSTSILSISVDDLILDNLLNLLSRTSSPLGMEKGDERVKNFIFNAGINIPARIYLFSTTPNMGQIYGIFTLNSFDECFSFFANHYPEQINFVDKQKSIVSVTLNSHLKIIFNGEHLIYQIGIDEKDDFGKLQALLMEPDTWSRVGDLHGFGELVTNKHLSYTQKDDGLHIEATVGKHKTVINGTWRLKQDLEDKKPMVRNLDTLEQTLIFWSVLPLKETPLLAYLMQKYTGLEVPQLDKSYSNYFDLQVKNNSVMQRDSSITYAYDDDFNPIEELQVQEHKVPSIVHAWKHNSSLQESLPDKMFYRFYKKQLGDYLLNTTLDSLPEQATSEETPYPLYCFINFQTWPDQWNISPFKKLKEGNVKLKIITQRENKRTLSINGEILY